MSRGTVLSLCDLTGHFVQPWLEADYDAILVDPQHGLAGDAIVDGPVTAMAETVETAMPYIVDLLQSGSLVFVAAFPPCTDMAVSGARWFADKRAADPMFQARAIMVAEQCRTIGRLSGAPWLVENPVSVLSSAFGPADYLFDPCDFTGHEPADNYTKRTCLWTGGGFRMPPIHRDPTLGAPDDRIHKAPPSEGRANFRSATPMGFARAVFAANGTVAPEVPS